MIDEDEKRILRRAFGQMELEHLRTGISIFFSSPEKFLWTGDIADKKTGKVWVMGHCSGRASELLKIHASFLNDTLSSFFSEDFHTGPHEIIDGGYIEYEGILRNESEEEIMNVFLEVYIDKMMEKAKESLTN